MEKVTLTHHQKRIIAADAEPRGIAHEQATGQQLSIWAKERFGLPCPPCRRHAWQPVVGLRFSHVPAYCLARCILTLIASESGPRLGCNYRGTTEPQITQHQ